jgi:hypothetical protein
MKKKSYKVEEEGRYGVVLPKMEVMAPSVENVDGPPLESVSLEEIVCSYGIPGKYKDCLDYGNAFCVGECKFGVRKDVEEVSNG